MEATKELNAGSIYLYTQNGIQDNVYKARLMSFGRYLCRSVLLPVYLLFISDLYTLACNSKYFLRAQIDLIRFLTSSFSIFNLRPKYCSIQKQPAKTE